MPPSLPNTASLQAVDNASFFKDAAHLRPVVRAVVSCVLNEPRDHVDVEDCTHEALRRAIEGRDTLKGELRPWLLGIARHVALDALRARKRARDREARVPRDDSSATSLLDRVMDPGTNPLDAVMRAERDHAVRNALTSLPDGPRRALELFHLQGLGYQEVATRLDVPIGTVATWITRGRKAIAESLEQGAKS